MILSNRASRACLTLADFSAFSACHGDPYGLTTSKQVQRQVCLTESAKGRFAPESPSSLPNQFGASPRQRTAPYHAAVGGLHG